MLKVLAIVPSGRVFGLQMATLNFFKYLDAKRISTRFLVTNWSDGKFVSRLKDLGFPYDFTYLGFLSKQLDWANIAMTLECVMRLPQLFFDLLRLMRRHKFDVIYVSGYHLLIQIFPIALYWRKPIVFHVHDCHINTPFYKSLFSLLDRVVTRYVTVSDAARSRLEMLGIDAKKIDRIHNGVDLSDYQFVRAKDVFRKRYSWSQSTQLVAFVGQISESKGLGDFIDAARIVCESNANVKMLVVGDESGEYAQYLRQRTHELGLDDRVIFCGFQEDVAEAFGSVDIVVVPSRCDEAFGLVAVEAMSAAKPVIVTRSGGLTEIVINNEQGFVVESGDVKGIANAIMTLLCDPGKALKMGEAGRERVEQMFSVQNQTHLLEACLFRVAGFNSDSFPMGDNADLQCS
jgi:glycosyltransferase involved in cell wall biosynthesis